MYTQKRNLRTPDVVSALQRSRMDDVYESALTRVVYSRQEDGPWRFFMGHCVAGPAEQAVADPAVYRNFAFLTSRIANFSSADFLEMLIGDGYVLSEDFPPVRMEEQNPNWTEEVVPSHVTTSGQPARQFSAVIERNGWFADIQLFAYGMPFHLSAKQHVTDFLGLETFHGQSDGRKGELIIEVPDMRGAIALTDRQLRIATDHQDLRLTGQLGDGVPVDLRAHDTLDIEDGQIGNVELWLLDRSSEIIDYRSSSEWPHRFEARAGSGEGTRSPEGDDRSRRK